MTDAIYAGLVLAVPFLVGVAVGVEIVKRRPKSSGELMGEIINHRVKLVLEQRRWVGDGMDISSTIELPISTAPKLQIIVKDAA